MKKAVLIFFFTCLVFNGFSQSPAKYFDSSKMVETGVYYYPEAWNPEQWDRDLAKIAEMGFEFTHFAEFAWTMIEPEEGRYDFTWLDKSVELAAKHGLKVIMCTPTPAPPVWLTQKYPEVLLVKDDGQRAQHGTREAYSWSSAKYRELTVKIVSEMAKRYGNDKRIWGWQIDNEPSHYNVIDYNPEVRISFINWLQKKYGTITELNKAWGTPFWSGVYNNFDQIVLPNAKTLISGIASPHSFLDFKRFSADECAGYVSLQFKTLKQVISADQFVTSNFMSFSTEVDPWRNKDLDFISYTTYPVAGYSDGVGDQGFRLGDPWRLSFGNDFFRPLKGVTGVMELQPGQVNWGTFNPQPYPGVIRAWLWNAFAGDLSFICSYRFRQPLYGGEQYHYGMVGTDGITISTGGMQYSQFMKEIRELRKQYDPKSVNPPSYESMRTGFLFNFDNYWNTMIQKQTFQWDYEKYFQRFFGVLKSLGAPVDFIAEDADFSKYKVLVAPAYQLLDKELVAKWRKYAENGGHLVLTSRTGQKDRNGHLFEAAWTEPISELIGGKVVFYDLLPANKWAGVSAGSSKYLWNDWADVLEPAPGTEVLATYTDQYYAGKAAVITRKLGKGMVTYIGPDTDDGKLERDMMKVVYERAGLKPVVLPEGVIREYRDGFGVAINYNSVPQTIKLPERAKIIFGSATLKPAEVVVWKE